MDNNTLPEEQRLCIVKQADGAAIQRGLKIKLSVNSEVRGIMYVEYMEGWAAGATEYAKKLHFVNQLHASNVVDLTKHFQSARDEGYEAKEQLSALQSKADRMEKALREIMSHEFTLDGQRFSGSHKAAVRHIVGIASKCLSEEKEVGNA